MKRSYARTCGWTLLALAVPLIAWAAAPTSKPSENAPARIVGLFEGMASGEIEVTVIPKDSTEGTVLVRNKTDQPLTIKFPEAFAGVPVLAQGGALAGAGLGGGGLGGGGRNANAGGMGGNQGFGGGMMGGMGGMMGGGMMGGGMFNVAAEKSGKVKITIVCLDHGKKDPNPRVPYKLIPIESYAKSPVVTEVVKMLVRGEIDQRSAQAAAWHLQNGLTWEELTNKVGAKHRNGTVEMYFNAAQLQRAMAAAKLAYHRAEEAPAETSLGGALAQQ